MSFIIALLVSAAVYLLIYGFHPYNIVAFVLTGGVAFVLRLLWRRYQLRVQTRNRRVYLKATNRYQLGLAQKIVLGLLGAIPVFVLVVIVASAGRATFVYGAFYDVDKQAIMTRIDIQVESGAYAAAIETVDDRLSRPASHEYQCWLAETKYVLLSKQANDEETQAEARDWANEWGKQCPESTAFEVRALPGPTPTPIPRPTPRPLPAGAVVKIIRQFPAEFDPSVVVYDLFVGYPDGRSISGLMANDVVAKVGYDEVPIDRTSFRSFEELPDPLNLVVAVDISGSMAEPSGGASVLPLDLAKEAVGVLLDQLRSQDRVVVIAFDHEVYVLTGWVSPSEASDVVNSLQIGGDTALWDAIQQVSNIVQDPPSTGPRVVVVLTDGNDTASQGSQSAAQEAASASGASLFVVGIESDDFAPGPIQELCAAAGGQFLGSSLDDLQSTFASIGGRVRNLYRLTVMTGQQGVSPNQIHLSVGGIDIK